MKHQKSRTRPPLIYIRRDGFVSSRLWSSIYPPLHPIWLLTGSHFWMCHYRMFKTALKAFPFLGSLLIQVNNLVSLGNCWKRWTCTQSLLPAARTCFHQQFWSVFRYWNHVKTTAPHHAAVLSTRCALLCLLWKCSASVPTLQGSLWQEHSISDFSSEKADREELTEYLTMLWLIKIIL